MTLRYGIVVILVFLMAGASVYAKSWTFDSKEDWLQCTLEHADPYTVPGSVRILQPISDDFTDDTLNDHWIWEPGQSSGNYYSLTTTTDMLTLTCTTSSDWWPPLDTAPKMYQPIEGDFEIETVSSWFQTIPRDWARVGLFIRQDSNNFLTINLFSSSTYFAIQSTKAVSAIPTTVTSTTITYSSPKPYYFKISRNGNAYATSYRALTTSAWTIDYSTSDLSFTPKFAGAFFYETSRSENAPLDYFYIAKSLTNTSATITSTIIDLGFIPSSKGYISWEQDNSPPGTNIAIQTQTSPDGISWENPSPQYPSNTQSQITSTNHRYIRFIAQLTGTSATTPSLEKVTIDYPAISYDPPTINYLRSVPNPAKGNCLNIAYDISDNAQKIELDLFAGGRNIHHALTGTQGGRNTHSIDVSALPNGVYFCRLTVFGGSGSSVIRTTKVILLR